MTVRPREFRPRFLVGGTRCRWPPMLQRMRLSGPPRWLTMQRQGLTGRRGQDPFEKPLDLSRLPTSSGFLASASVSSIRQDKKSSSLINILKCKVMMAKPLAHADARSEARLGAMIRARTITCGR